MVKQKVKQMGLPMVIPRQMDSDLDLLKVMRTVKMMVRLRKMEIGLVKKMVMRMDSPKVKRKKMVIVKEKLMLTVIG